jgi:hypothetical protein
VTGLERALARIATEIRPRTEIDTYSTDAAGRPGFDCCGCSTYDAIVDEVERILREERDAERGRG